MDQVLPLLQWSLDKAPLGRRRNLTTTFRDWHRASLLGIEIKELIIAGRQKNPDEVRRLNFWIHAGGAWRASALPYWQQAGLLSDVLSGNLGTEFPVGPAGGGRAIEAKLIPFRWYQPKHFQTELPLER